MVVSLLFFYLVLQLSKNKRASRSHAKTGFSGGHLDRAGSIQITFSWKLGFVVGIPLQGPLWGGFLVPFGSLLAPLGRPWGLNWAPWAPLWAPFAPPWRLLVPSGCQFGILGHLFCWICVFVSEVCVWYSSWDSDGSQFDGFCLLESHRVQYSIV